MGNGRRPLRRARPPRRTVPLHLLQRGPCLGAQEGTMLIRRRSPDSMGLRRPGGWFCTAFSTGIVDLSQYARLPPSRRNVWMLLCVARIRGRAWRRLFATRGASDRVGILYSPHYAVTAMAEKFSGFTHGMIVAFRIAQESRLAFADGRRHRGACREPIPAARTIGLHHDRALRGSLRVPDGAGGVALHERQRERQSPEKPVTEAGMRIG